MASPYLNSAIPMTNSMNVMGSAARLLQPHSNSVIQPNLYPQQFLSPVNPTLDLSLVKPIMPNVTNNISSPQLWMGKERDNTWLQLPVCPVFYRFYKEKESEMTISGGLGNYNLKDPNEATKVPECSDATCHSGFAHPPPNVMKHVLTSGYVVCCQSFVFATKNGATAQNAGCVRGEEKCRYFHPPENLAQIVINAGRNNKRLRSEMETKLKMTNALTAASIGGAVNPLPYQIPNAYSFIPQNQYSNPALIPNIQGTIPAIPNLSGLPSTGSVSSSLNKLSSTGSSNLRNIVHHSSPAVDYRQPSPPGVTKDRKSKDDDLTMAPPISRKRIYNDETKQIGYVAIKSVDKIEESDNETIKSTTKESPVAKRRLGDFMTINGQTLQSSVGGNALQSNGEVQAIPNLVSPIPSPVDATSLYSKAWAQQMKLLQQNPSQLISNTATPVNGNFTSNYTGLSGLHRSIPNGLPQVGGFDVDTYNATLLLNQSLANVSTQPYANTQTTGYSSAQPTAPFQTPYNIYDTSNSFWF